MTRMSSPRWRFGAPATTIVTAIACAAAVPPTAPDASLIAGPSALAPPAGVSGLPGQFVGLAGHQATGGVTLVIQGGMAWIRFDSAFAASSVPDPHVYLNTGANANSGRPLRIARLAAFSGAQDYAFQLPAGAADYTHVLVWCDKFNVGVGAAQLQRPSP